MALMRRFQLVGAPARAALPFCVLGLTCLLQANAASQEAVHSMVISYDGAATSAGTEEDGDAAAAGAAIAAVADAVSQPPPQPRGPAAGATSALAAREEGRGRAANRVVAPRRALRRITRMAVYASQSSAAALDDGEPNAHDIMCSLKDSMKQFMETGFFEGQQSLPKEDQASTCAVVSNSGVLLGSSNGEDIDAAEKVIRFNSAPTKDYEKFVGRREDVRFVNDLYPYRWSRGERPGGTASAYIVVPLMADPHVPYDFEAARSKLKDRNISCFRPAAVRQAMAAIRKIYDPNWWRDLGGVLQTPSSGFLAAMYALTICTEVKLYGMAATKVGAEYKYHYYGRRTESSISSNDHRGFLAEKDLWWRVAANPPEGRTKADVSVIPGFQTLSCDGVPQLGSDSADQVPSPRSWDDWVTGLHSLSQANPSSQRADAPLRGGTAAVSAGSGGAAVGGGGGAGGATDASVGVGASDAGAAAEEGTSSGAEVHVAGPVAASGPATAAGPSSSGGAAGASARAGAVSAGAAISVEAEEEKDEAGPPAAAAGGAPASLGSAGAGVGASAGAIVRRTDDGGRSRAGLQEVLGRLSTLWK